MQKPIFRERKSNRERQIAIVQEEIKTLTQEINEAKKTTSLDDINQRIEKFKSSGYKVTSSKERNERWQSLVSKIEYNRVGNIIDLKIFYH
jgi:glutamyl-tRNA reductase